MAQQQLKQTKNLSQDQTHSMQYELTTYQTLLKKTELDLVYAKHYLARRRRQIDFTQKTLTEVQAELQTAKQHLVDAQHLLTTKDEYVAWVDQELQDVRRSAELSHQQLKAAQHKNQLIANLVSIERPVNEGLTQFKTLLQRDYIHFIDHDMSSSDKHTALIQLKAIEQELELIVGFPEIYSKKMIAISGGFSSGKSEFVNSFIKDKGVQLAVGIQPMTAIPSYVIASQSTAIKGYSVNGGSIHLDVATYKAISHDFIKELGFDLKKLMPFMSIGVDMDEALFRDVCLIDTPGYNPSKTGSTDDDAKTASHYVSQADALIWVIGLDANGTISTSDLEFIKNLNLGEKPVFFVLNKADLRSEADIQSILDEISDILADEDIDYKGICSYSSLTKQTLTEHRMSLHDFIQEMNAASSIHHDLCVKIDQIFDQYQMSIKRDIQIKKDVELKMKSIRLDILETSHDELYKRTERRFGEMAQNFDTAILEHRLVELHQLRETFKQAVVLTMQHSQSS